MRMSAQNKTCLMKHIDCTGMFPTGYPGFRVHPRVTGAATPFQIVTYQRSRALHVHFAFITGSGEYLIITCSMIPDLTAFVVGLGEFKLAFVTLGAL